MGRDPFVEVAKQIVGFLQVYVQVFDPSFDHLAEILECFFCLGHLVQVLHLSSPSTTSTSIVIFLASARILLDHHSSLPILKAQLIGIGNSIDCQIINIDLHTVGRIQPRIQYPSGLGLALVGLDNFGVMVIPPGDIVTRVQQSPVSYVCYVVQ